jgi:hypothetical protein
VAGLLTAIAITITAIVCADCGGLVAPSADAGGACGQNSGDCLPDPGFYCASGSIGCLCPTGETPQASDPSLSCGTGTKSGSAMAFCCTYK